MSPAANRKAYQTVGNTARTLNDSEYAQDLPLGSQAAPARSPEPEVQRPRTPLSLVVSAPTRSRPRLAVAVFMLIVAAMSAVLIMSVSVSQGQYTIVALKSQQSDLKKSNQGLEQDLGAKEAPQSLVANATGMGMVPATSTGQIDIRTKAVTGNPLPAAAGAQGLASIPPAMIDTPRPAVPAPADAPPAQGSAAAQIQAESEAQKKVAAKPAPGPDLNGGTIPAPAQKDN